MGITIRRSWSVAMDFQPPNRPTGMRPGFRTLIASGICLVVTVAFCGGLLFFSDRASEGNAQAIAFFSIFAVFPCLASVVLLVIGIVQLSRRNR